MRGVVLREQVDFYTDLRLGVNRQIGNSFLCLILILQSCAK